MNHFLMISRRHLASSVQGAGQGGPMYQCLAKFFADLTAKEGVVVCD
jgi:hypothetical protein